MQANSTGAGGSDGDYLLGGGHDGEATHGDDVEAVTASITKAGKAKAKAGKAKAKRSSMDGAEVSVQHGGV